MAISGFIGAGVQDALSQQVAEQLRQAMFEEEQRQAQAREAMTAREQARREAEDRVQQEQMQFLRSRLTEQDAQAANAQRAAELEKQTAQSRASDMANVMQMPGLSQEQRMAEVTGIGTRGGEIGAIDLLKLNTPAPPKTRAVTMRGPRGEPINAMVPEDVAVEEWRAPQGQTAASEMEWVIGPDGNIVKAPKDAPIPGSKPYSQSSGGLAAQSAAVRNKRVATAMNAIEKLKELAPERSPGLPGIVQGVGQTLKGYAGYDTRVRQYNALLQPTAMQMAVAIQGAANLSDSERMTMAGALGQIHTMDYESQMALLNNAAELLAGSGDVQKMPVKDANGVVKERWVPVNTGPNAVQMTAPSTSPAPPSLDAILQKYGATIVPRE